jgi:hypothetical protein
MAARLSRATRSVAMKLIRFLVDVAGQCDGVPKAGTGALDESLAHDGGQVAHFVAFDVRARVHTEASHRQRASDRGARPPGRRAKGTRGRSQAWIFGTARHRQRHCEAARSGSGCYTRGRTRGDGCTCCSCPPAQGLRSRRETILRWRPPGDESSVRVALARRCCRLQGWRELRPTLVHDLTSGQCQ